MSPSPSTFTTSDLVPGSVLKANINITYYEIIHDFHQSLSDLLFTTISLPPSTTSAEKDMIYEKCSESVMNIDLSKTLEEIVEQVDSHLGEKELERKRGGRNHLAGDLDFELEALAFKLKHNLFPLLEIRESRLPEDKDRNRAIHRFEGDLRGLDLGEYVAALGTLGERVDGAREYYEKVFRLVQEEVEGEEST